MTDAAFLRSPEAAPTLAAWIHTALAARASEPLRVLQVRGLVDESSEIAGALVDAGVDTNRVVVGTRTLAELQAEPAAACELIVCRDLIVALDADAQGRTLSDLARLLTPDGILVLGAAERFAAKRAGLRPVGNPDALAFATTDSLVSIRATGSSAVVAPAPDRRRVTGRVTVPGGLRAVAPATRRTPLGAIAVMPTSMPPVPGAPAALAPVAGAPIAVAPLAGAPSAGAPSAGAPRAGAPVPEPVAMAERLADAGHLVEAAGVCETYLLANPTCLEALALLGAVRDAMGDLDGAAACHHAVLQIDPEHADALLSVAHVRRPTAS